MTRRSQHDVTFAVVALEDAREELSTTATAVSNDDATTTAALREQLEMSTQAIEHALQRMADVQSRLQQHLTAPGLPVSDVAHYLNVSEPTVRAWLTRGALTPVPGAKPVLVEVASLRRAGHALAELRERGRDRDWTRALVDLLHDHGDRRRPELLEGLDELRRGELEPA
jgi:hypothetical protein